MKGTTRNNMKRRPATIMAGILVFLLSANAANHRPSRATAFVAYNARRSKFSSSSSIFALKNGASKIFKGENEWEIPDSQSLPPLSSSSSPKPSLPNGGHVTLVGSGPGDPELLTLAAHRLLADPDVLVIADRLVSKEILELIKGEIKVARKLPGCAELAQEEIYWWAYQGLAEGKHVIRLKIGDPFVFGRGGEEVLTFRRFGVEPTVIPVSSTKQSAQSIWNGLTQ